jgi:hypothetical protein
MPIDPAHPLYSVDLKLSRVAEQLKDFDSSIRAFFDSEPYSFEEQADPEEEILWRVVRVHRQADPNWSTITGEIIHNLRSALDYIVYQLVLLETKAEPKGSKNQFPIFKSEDGFRSNGLPHNLEGVGTDAVALIKAMQPFATGEGERSPLWQLRVFSNLDKHRDIHLTAASVPSSSVEASVESGDFGIYLGPGGLLTDNAPLYGRSIPAGPEPLLERAAKIKLDGKATIHITFEKPAVNFGLKAQHILDVMRQRVLEIANRINAEIFKR